MKTVILFRKKFYNKREFEIASKYFDVFESRILCGGSRVIGRYSVEPYYQELADDLKYNSCKLINSVAQHDWITSFDWYYYYQKYGPSSGMLTPETWHDHEFSMSTYRGPFVVKGKCTSNKFYWNTLMFAANRKEASEIAFKLNSYPNIGEEGIIYREYIPLRIFEIGLNDLPITNEWRFFFYKDKLLTYGYYWSISHYEGHEGELTEEAINFAKKCALIASSNNNFYTLDIAERAEGGWILIDVNDGQCSELNGCDPEILYGELKNAIEEEKEEDKQKTNLL